MTAIKPAAALSGSDARDRILRAAERLFAEKGYAATAVHEITEAAQVNKALLYYYFTDKRAVHVSLIDNGIAEFRRMIDAALSSPGSHAERLKTFIRSYVRLVWEHAALLRVVQRCLIAGEEDAVDLIGRFEVAVAPLVRFFEEGTTAGEFRAANPAMVVLSLIGMVDKFLCADRPQGPRFPPEQIIVHITDLLLHGLATSEQPACR